MEELNKTISDLKKEIEEYKVKIMLKEKEGEELKKENEKLRGEMTPTTGPENRKIKLLEDDKDKLKKEIDEIWLTVERKESEL